MRFIHFLLYFLIIVPWSQTFACEQNARQPINKEVPNVYNDFFAAVEYAKEQGLSLVVVMFTRGYHPYLEYLCCSPESVGTFQHFADMVSYALLMPHGDETENIERIQTFRQFLSTVACDEWEYESLQRVNSLDPSAKDEVFALTFKIDEETGLFLRSVERPFRDDWAS